MVDEDRYCIDVVTQITAIQAALDKVALGLLEDHANHCVIGGDPPTAEERTAELMGAVKRLLEPRLSRRCSRAVARDGPGRPRASRGPSEGRPPGAPGRDRAWGKGGGDHGSAAVLGAFRRTRSAAGYFRPACWPEDPGGSDRGSVGRFVPYR